MIKVTVCIGSHCHLKGCGQVVETFRELIAAKGLAGKVELEGTFCMGICHDDVAVSIDGETFSVSPETAESFFNEKVAAKFIA